MRALADAMGVSQTPVREALTRLLSEKVVIMDGRAIKVPLVERASFEEIFRLRPLLEADLAQRVSLLLTRQMIDAQERTQAEFGREWRRKTSD